MIYATICTSTYTCAAAPADVNLRGMFRGRNKLACQAAHTHPVDLCRLHPSRLIFLWVSRLNIASVEMCFHAAGILYCVGVPMSTFPYFSPPKLRKYLLVYTQSLRRESQDRYFTLGGEGASIY
jgi:hypothetical protein